jgi:hypothetical protein
LSLDSGASDTTTATLANACAGVGVVAASASASASTRAPTAKATSTKEPAPGMLKSVVDMDAQRLEPEVESAVVSAVDIQITPDKLREYSLIPSEPLPFAWTLSRKRLLQRAAAVPKQEVQSVVLGSESDEVEQDAERTSVPEHSGSSDYEREHDDSEDGGGHQNDGDDEGDDQDDEDDEEEEEEEEQEQEEQEEHDSMQAANVIDHTDALLSNGQRGGGFLFRLGCNEDGEFVCPYHACDLYTWPQVNRICSAVISHLLHHNLSARPLVFNALKALSHKSQLWQWAEKWTRQSIASTAATATTTPSASTAANVRQSSRGRSTKRALDDSIKDEAQTTPKRARMKLSSLSEEEKRQRRAQQDRERYQRKRREMLQARQFKASGESRGSTKFTKLQQTKATTSRRGRPSKATSTSTTTTTATTTTKNTTQQQRNANTNSSTNKKIPREMRQIVNSTMVIVGKEGDKYLMALDSQQCLNDLSTDAQGVTICPIPTCQRALGNRAKNMRAHFKYVSGTLYETSRIVCLY